MFSVVLVWLLISSTDNNPLPDVKYPNQANCEQVRKHVSYPQYTKCVPVNIVKDW